MAMTNDIILNGTAYTVVPGTYKKRNKRSGGRAARTERVTVDQFKGQRQAFDVSAGILSGFGWDAPGVGPALDGQGVEPFPNTTSFADANVLDTPSATQRAYGVVAGANAFVGIGRRIYKSVALSNGTWAALIVAADLGAGFVISGLAYNQDDLLVMLASGQDIRKFNTVSNAISTWRAGEKGQVGAGYASQLIYAPKAANNQEELRLSGTKWNGNAVTHLRYLDSPILSMALFNGTVAIATRTSLYRMGGQPYPGEADDATVTADTSKAPEWRGEPEPLMTHGQFAAGDDFTFLASFRGRLYTWLQGRVAEYDGDRTWTRMGPEGVRCYGGVVAGDWLTVAIESRYGGAELWGFDGAGWWLLVQRATPAMIWPCPLAGAGNRELVLFRDGSTTYDLARFNWRSASVNTYSTDAEWRSALLDGGAPGVSKAWTAVSADFAVPANRGNPASGDQITYALDYSSDAGATWITAASATTSAAASRTASLSATFPSPVNARALQVRVRWSSISDWAPVLASVAAEYEVPEIPAARLRVWELVVDASDRTVRRDGGRDPRDGRSAIRSLWDAWEAGGTVSFVETDGGLWDPSDLAGRALWLKADALSGLLEGEAIGDWPDATGNGEAAVQAAAAARPTYREKVLGGLPVARFDGSDWLTVASTLGIGAQPFSQFALWKPSGTGQRLMTWASNGLFTTDFDNDVGIFSGGVVFDFDHHPFNAWHIVAATHNGATGSVTVDGGTPTVGNTGGGAPAGDLTIGAEAGGASNWLNGELAELIVTRTALTTVERQRLEGYAAHKWGLTALLPGNHPYKSEPPRRGTVVRIESIEEQVTRPANSVRWGEASVALILEEV